MKAETGFIAVLGLWVLILLGGTVLLIRLQEEMKVIMSISQKVPHISLPRQKAGPKNLPKNNAFEKSTVVAIGRDVKKNIWISSDTGPQFPWPDAREAMVQYFKRRFHQKEFLSFLTWTETPFMGSLKVFAEKDLAFEIVGSILDVFTSIGFDRFECVFTL